VRLITGVKIEGFRSIRDAELPALSDFTALAGLNNSGKSNFLRALNAFFAGHTDPGKVVRVDDDYYRPDLRKKKRKRIRIAVTFALPDEFRFRTGLEPVEGFLGGRQFTVAKEWQRGNPEPVYHLNDGPSLDPLGRSRIDQFLQLISFRYIPNRVQPLDVVRNEHQALRDVLVRRLGVKAGTASATFTAIRETSESLIAPLAKRFQEALPYAGDVRLATPSSWADMLFTFGYRLLQGSVELDDTAQGSGTQSLLMLETLYLIDRDYFQKFGWRQAAIWAVEEPEASLHSSLEARVALYLSSIARGGGSRLQVFCTTHSDLMVQYATKAIVVHQRGAETKFDTGVQGRDALERLSKAGVSRWVHPIMHHPLEPLVLVEGKRDHEFLHAAFRLLRPRVRIELSYLELLGDGVQTGGVGDLANYIRANAAVIRARVRSAPVVVVLDWDARNKLQQFQRPFSADDPFRALAWPDEALNPALGRSFHGIERCYSTRMIEEAERRGAVIARRQDGTMVVEEGQYGSVKDILAAVVRDGLEIGDLVHARVFLEAILRDAGIEP
jgi:hypothetical protein